MPALNFKAQFAGAVESGKKRQTIRAYRKDGRDPKPGDRLVLYTGMRTKGCRKLGEAKCVTTVPITIDRKSVALGQGGDPMWIATLAADDGFESWDAFFDFFTQTHGLPFEGLLIRWGGLIQQEDQT